MKGRVFEETDGDMGMYTSTRIRSYVGGCCTKREHEALQSLTKFVRDPGVPTTAEEALNMLRIWRTLQKRGQEVGIPALCGNERFTLLVKMISKLEKRHSQFSHR
eukprot:12920639-Prorocentrum_lima.AAC.1